MIDPVAEYTSIQTIARASHYYTRNQIAERRAHHPSLKQRVVSTVVVLMLLTWSFVITVAKNETVRERSPYSQN